jgi:drug/metabolite transporter (DMT)-like permease
VTRPPPASRVSARVASLTALTLCFFAANSLLARAALGGGLADAAGFTAVRLASGALGLAALVAVTGRGRPAGGSWGAAVALFAYAAAFSLAYVRIPAGPGALVLFAAVQVTMIGWSVVSGARPSGRQWFGMATAMVGLAGLTLPGASAPDLGGTALMMAAGAAWGAYSLLGRGAADPMAATAANFARSVVPALAFALAFGGGLQVSPAGLGLASASGALASGVGYTLWYAVLPSLGATRAAVVQLSVPVLTPLAAAILLSEPVTPRLVVAGATILAGVGLAMFDRSA